MQENEYSYQVIRKTELPRSLKGVQGREIVPYKFKVPSKDSEIPHAGHKINDKSHQNTQWYKTSFNLHEEELDRRYPPAPPPGIQPRGPPHICPSWKVKNRLDATNSTG